MNINAATFQYFREPEGAELLARVFLLEPNQVELQSRTKGTSKRRPNLTYQELEVLAENAGVSDLYLYAVARFEAVLHKHTTRSSVGFAGLFDGSRNIVFSLLPGESSSETGLRYQLYFRRFCKLAGLEEEAGRAILPAHHDDWIYYETAGPDYEGFEGFITSRDEIDRLAEALPGR